jgi:predicted nuclease of predicted toxin-antitoxin system
MHVYLIGLDTAQDSIIWEYALDNEFVIVTRDADFSDLNVMLGFPPKVIWIRRGKQQVAEIFKVVSETLEFEQFEVDEFVAQADKVVVLGRSRDRMKATGQVVENRWEAVWVRREGKVAKYHVYEDTAAFVEALR